jgi:NADH dehydrogenase
MAQLDAPAPAPHVVIVGAGFGGLNAAMALGRAPVQVTLIDQHNYHLFQPLLYQVATAGLSPGNIAYPIRAVVRKQANTRVLLAEVAGIDTVARKVILRDSEIAYDFLILATGARHSYFSHPEWEKFAPGLKTIDDALAIRRRILLSFEHAEIETDAEKRKALLTFVVIGGGPTGVELAGAISEIAYKVMAQDFRSIDTREARTILVEAGPHILPAFPEELSIHAASDLAKLGVEVRTNSPVTAIGPGVVTIKDQAVHAGTVLWAAGVTASNLAQALHVPLDRAGRVLIHADLTIPKHPEVFVIGDLAALTDPKSGKLLPGVAPVAMQQGRHAAANIQRAIQREALKPFHYWDRGIMATIGRNAAIASIGRITLTGFVAWIAWLFVHILFLIGFRNRLIVLFDWAWAYLSFQRSARLITGGTSMEKRGAGGRANNES